MSIPFHCQQLEFMKQLVACRVPFLDPIFRALNYVDSIYFVFLIVPFIWVGFSYRWGIRLYYWILINSLVNTYFKSYLAWPRPCTDLPELGFFQFSSYGCPSGGAQLAMFLGGVIIYYWKHKFAKALGIAYILILSFTRLYIGAHYPVDVLGGWTLGLILLLLFTQTEKPLERFLSRKGLLFSFILSEAIPIALGLISCKTVYKRYDAIAIGLGIYLSLRFKLYLNAPRKIHLGIIRGSIAVFGIFFLYFITENQSVPIKFGLGSLWLSLFASPFCRWVTRNN
jgi:membrane-associated phospholipid phosphatase